MIYSKHSMYPAAVMGDGQITTFLGTRPYPTASINNVIGIAQIALTPGAPIRSVWIAPGSDIDKASQNEAFWEAPNVTWKVFSTGSIGKAPSAASVHRNDVQGAERREVMIYGDIVDRWMAPELDGENHQPLLQTIESYERAMGMQARFSPASTAIALLESIHINCERATWLKPLSREAIDNVPWSHPHAPAHVNAQCSDGRYVHVYDKRSAYMASAMCKVGQGDPTYWATPDVPLWQNLIKAEMPALWCITAKKPDSEFVEHMPNPFNTHGDMPYHEWYYTPQVKLAQFMGYQIEFHAAWAWTDAHATLTPWVQRLWQARQSVRDTPAEAMVKASFTQSLGVFNRKPGTTEKIARYHRPDFGGLITAQHYLRQVKKIIELSAIPGYLALSTDSFAWICDDPDPLTAIPYDWMGPDGQLGQYRVVASYAGEQAQALIHAARDGAKASKLYKMMEAWDADNDDVHGTPDE